MTSPGIRTPMATCVNVQRKSRPGLTLRDMKCVPVRYAIVESEQRTMNITLSLVPVVSILAGILILVIPRLLSTIVAIYLIVVGLVGLFGSGSLFR